MTWRRFDDHVCRRRLVWAQTTAAMKRWREDLTTPLTLPEASSFIESVEWRFAKTMPHIPHWYTMSTWNPATVEQFRGFVLLIAQQGVVIPWPKPPAKPRSNAHYLFIDGWKYWHLDADPMVTILVNRAAVEPDDRSYQRDGTPLEVQPKSLVEKMKSERAEAVIINGAASTPL